MQLVVVHNVLCYISK